MLEGWKRFPRQLIDFYKQHPGLLIELVGCLVWFYWGSTWPVSNVHPNDQRTIQSVESNDGGQTIWDFRYTETLVDPTSWITRYPFRKKGYRLPLAIQLCLIVLFSGHSIVPQLHATLCVYHAALGTSWLITTCLKLYVGCWRPNSLETCEYDLDNCNNDDARKSFPSGHSTSAMCRMMLLACYLYYCFIGKARSTKDWKRRYGSVLSCVVCLGYAALIGASRIVDHKHFPADVTAGALIGGSVGYVFFHLWFVEELCGSKAVEDDQSNKVDQIEMGDYRSNTVNNMFA